MRVKAVQEILKKHGTDGILITSTENRRYVSGFTGGDGIILITLSDSVLFVDGRYTIQAQLEAKEFTVITFKTKPYGLLKDYNLKNLFIEDTKLPLSDYKSLKETLLGTCFHNGSWVLDELRMIKSPDEAEKIKKAAEIADNAFSHILNFIKEGMSERDIALELEFFMRSRGAEGISFDTIIASAERSALPHASLTDRKIALGDVLLIDFGCKFEGYCSDMTRTVAVGKASDEFKKVYKTALTAQNEALSNIKAGAPCRDIDAYARRVIESAGYGAYFAHSLGHGVGLNVHEKPVVSTGSDGVLCSGNVITVEPGIYLQNKFGVRIEDLVLVTDTGFDNFTHSPKELIII
ncbi:MAG: putative peptidase [Firmicutes bacterium ADurb.Bin193]|nr:MAG: putative peptidase [Firmicutes bacterium ADurb.Bin193]